MLRKVKYYNSKKNGWRKSSEFTESNVPTGKSLMTKGKAEMRTESSGTCQADYCNKNSDQ